MAKRQATTTPGRGESAKPDGEARAVGGDSPGSLILRPYQRANRDQFHSGIRRIINIWHRRAGKDIDALDQAAEESRSTVGTYWHLYPTHTQARKAIWNGIDARAGVRFIDRAFPPEERKSTLKQDMTIELENGSIWQLCGSDRFDSLVGSNPVGVTFSEWALCDPRAWSYVRPIIRENGGWVRFITTYRGRNHAYRMVQRLKNNPDWYVDVRTVNDTTDNDGNPILTPADIQAERDEGMSESLIQQEYFCNPVAARPGSVYGRALERVFELNRVGTYGFEPSRPVLASWYSEPSQHTVIFWQTQGNERRIIGSKSYPFHSLTEAIDDVEQRFPWKYIARHIVPHNALEAMGVFENRGLVTDCPGEVTDKVDAVRDFISGTYIDEAPRNFADEEPNNENLIDALNGYRFTEARGGESFTATTVAGWERHYARALETFALYCEDENEQLGGWHPPPSRAAKDRRMRV